MNQTKPRRLGAILLALLLMLAMVPSALADTDENTPRITQQPDQLVLQLGVRWAGVEFELRTDAGRFPVPVVVDESGILTMDLGGSTTYMLSCMDSSVPVPSPELEELGSEEISTPQPEKEESSVNHLLVVFVILLLIVIVVLAVLLFQKQRQEDVYDDWDDEEEAL